jgi:hypothetical protein
LSTAQVDQRQININFVANNVAEAEAIANLIVNELAKPPRFGTAQAAY